MSGVTATPQHQINVQMLHSVSQAPDKADSRTHGLEDLQVYLVFGAPSLLGFPEPTPSRTHFREVKAN